MKRKIFLLIIGIFLIGLFGALIFQLVTPYGDQECSHLFQKTACALISETEHETVTVCRTCGELLKSEKSVHVYKYVVRNLTAEELADNPRAISRETLVCEDCRQYKADNAIYESMTFDSRFDLHSNLTADSLPTVSNGKYTVTNSLYLTDALHLSGNVSLLKEYSVMFDVVVNLDPATVDYHPSDGSGTKKPPIFFALIDGGNKWDYKNCALGLNRDHQNDAGEYELLLYSHSWCSLPKNTYFTNFFVELGKEYSIKMDFVLDADLKTYKVTLFARGADAADYVDCGTFDIVYYYSSNTSYIYFEGVGNTFDNFKIVAPFVKD